MVYEAMEVTVCYLQTSVMPELLRRANKFICLSRRLFNLFRAAQAWDPKLDQSTILAVTSVSGILILSATVLILPSDFLSLRFFEQYAGPS